MSKLYLLIALLCAGIAPAISQSIFTTVTINKNLQPGLVLHLPDNTDVAEGTILQKLKETGYSPETKGKLFWKKNKRDGFYVFNGITLPALNNQKLDMYFKVERESKSQKEQSIIYLLVSKGYDNFISPQVDSVTFLAATEFLNGFVATTASYRLKLDIEEQDKIVQSAEKKLAGLQDDEKSLIKKIDELQADLRNKKEDQAMQEKEIANQKMKLEELKAKMVNQ
ncbi:MAG: coiled-coil domain-containing protein [Chitinophagaceae bacterium]